MSVWLEIWNIGCRLECDAYYVFLFTVSAIKKELVGLEVQIVIVVYSVIVFEIVISD
jgi:hypothetical protein